MEKHGLTGMFFMYVPKGETEKRETMERCKIYSPKITAELKYIKSHH
jgi:hypothetical protein